MKKQIVLFLMILFFSLILNNFQSLKTTTTRSTTKTTKNNTKKIYYYCGQDRQCYRCTTRCPSQKLYEEVNDCLTLSSCNKYDVGVFKKQRKIKTYAKYKQI